MDTTTTAANAIVCTNGSFQNQPTTSSRKRRCRGISVVLQDATNVDLCKRRCTGTAAARIADQVQRCAPRGNSTYGAESRWHKVHTECNEVTECNTLKDVLRINPTAFSNSKDYIETYIERNNTSEMQKAIALRS